jgi:hypothetical protein
MMPFVPKPLTSGSKSEGRFGKQDFVYVADDDTWRCPAGERLTSRYISVEHGMNLYVYWTTACSGCPIKAKCTTGKERRIKRWEHETVLDTMQRRLDEAPEKMEVRRQTAPVRHHQGLDGFDTFSDEDPAPGEHGDEPPRAGLQSEARDEGPGGRAAEGGHASIKGMGFIFPNMWAFIGPATGPWAVDEISR